MSSSGSAQPATEPAYGPFGSAKNTPTTWLASLTTTDPESPFWPKKTGSVAAPTGFKFGMMIMTFE